MEQKSGAQKLFKNIGIGLMSAGFTQPFQTLRTSAIRSVLADKSVGPASFYRLARRIVAQQGWLSLFRGTSYGMAKNGLSIIVFLQNITFFTPRVKSFLNIPEDKRNASNPLYFLEGLLMASCSKVITVATVNPIIVLKTNVEIAGSQHKGLRSLVSDIYSKQGASGFFRGIMLTMMRDVPWSGLQFSFYRTFLKLHQRFITGQKSRSFIFINGAISSLVASLMVHPFDNLRVRVQTSAVRTSPMRVLRSTLSEQGLKGLYRGVQARLLKKALSGGILWSMYKIVWDKDEIQI